LLWIRSRDPEIEQYLNPKADWVPMLIGGAVYITGAIIYAMRIPEKWFPKKFDLLGASH